MFNADQIGLTPEEVISKIMANPDVAMAFQNPRVQAAIMDVSNFSLSIFTANFVSKFSDFGPAHFFSVLKIL